MIFLTVMRITLYSKLSPLSKASSSFEGASWKIGLDEALVCIVATVGERRPSSPL